MEEPIVVKSTAEAFFYSLTWFSALMAFLALGIFIKGVSTYYLSSGDEEEMKKGKKYGSRAFVYFIISVILGATAFYFK